ncbi:MAG: PHP domain-containing protein [Acidimicrobiales bacterium]
MTVEELAEFCDKAQSAGIVEIALTEHLFRFEQVKPILGSYFRRFPERPMRTLMEQYWHDHAKADLDHYVEVVQAAKQAGLPVILGLEVDYYEGEMDAVSRLLDGYPFDVLLGSIHWIADWPFDHISDPTVVAEWNQIGIEPAWEAYTRSLEELSATRAVDVLAHPDLIKIMGYRSTRSNELHARMAEAAAKAGIAAEVSSAGWRKPVNEVYPSPDLLSEFAQRQVAITTASDSHGNEHVGFQVREVRRYINDHGYQKLRGFRGRQAYDVELSSEP